MAHHHGANREPFSSLGAALDARHYEGADQAKLKRVVDFLASKLGTVTEVSIAQRGNAIDVCFGGDEQVGLFIHRGYADVPPKHVEQLGGFALLVAARPGFIAHPASAATMPGSRCQGIADDTDSSARAGACGSTAMKRRAAFDDRQLTRASVIAIAGLVRCEACGARRSRSRIVSWCERNTQMEPQNSAPTRRSARLAAGAPEERITLVR